MQLPRYLGSGYDSTYGDRRPPCTNAARTTLTGRATQALNRFDLDLLGPSVTSVKVNGVSARWTTTKQGELVITPTKALARGSRFVVQVGVKKSLPNRSTDSFPPGLVRDGDRR
ncbi:hypothetical protein OG394_18010 [Kribbella sp. NBC_01245]|uniref:hypothetical protein n=1 Tax=Kribbella sp. NBC_01245 TaxID=2903578 RepID=UPI002E28C354|nr:hypothetical protein [Kribbella sp. NBC_01245]